MDYKQSNKESSFDWVGTLTDVVVDLTSYTLSEMQKQTERKDYQEGYQAGYKQGYQKKVQEIGQPGASPSTTKEPQQSQQKKLEQAYQQGEKSGILKGQVESQKKVQQTFQSAYKQGYSQGSDFIFVQLVKASAVVIVFLIVMNWIFKKCCWRNKNESINETTPINLTAAGQDKQMSQKLLNQMQDIKKELKSIKRISRIKRPPRNEDRCSLSKKKLSSLQQKYQATDYPKLE